MKGCGCGRLANSGCWTAGRPKASGLGLVLGPSGIGDAAAAAGGARTRAKTNETAERMGAQLNAYTSHDVVAFHITCRSEAAMAAVDLLSDFVGRARIDADELDRERGVVIQEIARSDDQPADVADRLLDQATY